MNQTTTFITLNDGTEICAPNQLNLMSNYVLREQGDWFEDEIHFVRNFIKPGMVALDIGANYGLYSTAIAKKLGDNGKLWCFEPTPNTANALRSTIERNALTKQVEIIESGLSDHIGEATFYVSPNAELNSLSSDNVNSADSLTIKLLTLDHCNREYNWQTIDFIKLDAEGEEANILKKATETLENCSPLIMFELKHGRQINHSLISDFNALGYKSYHLIPGLNIIVPLNLSVPVDTYLLNLFCCKANTAEKLEQEGYLVSASEALKGKVNAEYDNFFSKIPSFKNQESRSINDQDYREALNAYISYCDKSLNKKDRYQYLLFAFDIVKKVLKKGESKIDRLSTYARIAFDIGQRKVGLQICDYVITKHLQNPNPITITEPYIPINQAFESINQKQQENAWLLASFVDQYIRKHAYSCYFTNDLAIPYFNVLRELGFMSSDMEKREQVLLELIKQKKS